MAIVATILGIAGGVVVAKLLIQVFNSAGAGFPSTATVLRAAHGRHGVRSSASASRWRR